MLKTILNARTLFFGVFITFALLFPFPIIYDQLVDEPVSNLLHFPIGFLGVYLLSRIVIKDSTGNRVFIPSSFLGVFMLLLACTVEFLQEITGRSASFEDIHITFWGILCGIAFVELYAYKSEHKIIHRILFGVSILIGGLVSIVPIFLGYALFEEREQHYPVLLQPQTKLPRLLVPVEFTALEPNPNENCSVKVYTKRDQWGGFELPVGDKDWSSYNTLKITLKNESTDTLDLLVRIDDSGDSLEKDLRFGNTWHIEPETVQEIKIPVDEIKSSVAGKDFNLQEVHRIVLASNQEGRDSIFCIFRIELE